MCLKLSYSSLMKKSREMLVSQRLVTKEILISNNWTMIIEKLIREKLKNHFSTVNPSTNYDQHCPSLK